MTELQQMGEFPYDEPEQQDIEQAEPEQEEANLSDISPESEPETETNAEDQPHKAGNKLQERLDKLTAEKYEAKRRADELEARLKQLEGNKPQALPEDLIAPVMPEDTWDAEQMRKYDAEMRDYYRKLAQHEARNVLTSTEQQRKQQLHQAEQAKTVQTFAQRAIKTGISIEQLEAAGTGLVNAGLSQELQMLIMEDEAGPQITMHLAKNPELAYEILSLPPTKAAIKLATSIKAAAIGNKPKVTGAPDPIPEGKPSSMREKSDFESRFPNAKFI